MRENEGFLTLKSCFDIWKWGLDIKNREENALGLCGEGHRKSTENRALPVLEWRLAGQWPSMGRVGFGMSHR